MEPQPAGRRLEAPSIGVPLHRDLLLQQSWRGRQTEAMINCRARAAELHLRAIKIVAAEYNYDGSRLVLMFSTDSDDKPDLKSLRKDMQAMYPNTQVEMRQIGPRDVAKILGGMGACGLETRCCSKFLTDFSPISIKMAKEQGISAQPDRDHRHVRAPALLPDLRVRAVRRGAQAAAQAQQARGHAAGEGKVIDVMPLSNQAWSWCLWTAGRQAPSVSPSIATELQPWDELEALKRKAEAPCDRHEGGGCTCGKADKS